MNLWHRNRALVVVFLTAVAFTNFTSAVDIEMQTKQDSQLHDGSSTIPDINGDVCSEGGPEPASKVATSKLNTI
jgi:hypothetical protein